MRRIERTSVDAEVLRQARNIRTWSIAGIALIIFAVLRLFYLFPFDTFLLSQTLIAIGIGCVGLAMLLISLWMMGRMPPAERRTVYDLTHSLPETTIVPTAPNQQRRANHGLNALEWRQLCTALARGNRWKLSRAILESEGIQDLTTYVEPGLTKYGKVKNGLIFAGMMMPDGSVPPHMRHYYTSPTLGVGLE